MHRRRRPPCHRRPSSRRCARAASAADCRPSSPISSACATSTAAATRRPASTRSARWAADVLRALGRDGRATAGPRRPARRHGHRGRSRAAPGAGPTAPVIGHMDTVFDPGTAAARPFRIDGRHRQGPGRHRHEGRPPGRAVRDRRRSSVDGPGGLPFERLVFVANPDEEIGSPSSTPHIRRLAAERRRLPRPGVRAGERRLRVGAQGHRRPPAYRSTAAPRTPASSPRRAAARSSRRRGSSTAIHALNGRWPDVTANVGVFKGGHAPEHRAPTAPSSRSTSGR